MNTESQDVRSSNLLNGIKKLNTELTNELVENILELTTNPISIENTNQLKRIERATDQYRRRTNNLFYIGFLGHFSSGKSSTINSILSLNGTTNEKKTNHNPTDDQITLITCKENSEDVLKLTSHGQIPVVVTFIESNDSLKDKVIMDTPGSGDPSTFEEIVRDSLPLCDLLIYCMAATHPFTNADIPLLKEKEEHLANIPTLFLVTRGNEFKVNTLEVLDKKNFDSDKYTKFASELAARIRQGVNIEVEYNNFILIDNNEKYEIDTLKDKIDFYCNPENYGNILRLHDHKIDYFTKTLKAIKEYFIQLIIVKLDTIEKYFIQAKVKLQEYEKNTLIGTDKMLNSWRIIDDKIKQTLDGSIFVNNNIYKSLSTPPEFSNLKHNKNWYTEIYKTDKINNKYKVEAYKTQIKSSLIDLKWIVQKRLFELIDNNSPLNIASVENDINSHLEERHFENTIEDNILERYAHYYEETFEYLNSSYFDLKRQLDSLKARTKNNNPIENIEKHISEAKLVLKEIFETYKNGVKIFTVAAFSTEAKSYIKKLGLSDQLDQIDNTKPDINLHLSQAQCAILNDYNISKDKFEKSCSYIYIKLNTITYDTPIITTESNIKDIKNDEFGIVNSYNLKFKALQKESNDNIKNYFYERIQSINSRITRVEIAKAEDFKSIKRKRFLYYLKSCLPFCLILLITIGLFFVLPKYYPLDNLTVGQQWILGLVINGSSALLTFIISKRKDRYKEYKENVKSKILENKKEIVSNDLEEGFEDFKVELIDTQSQLINEQLNQQTDEILKMISAGKYNSSNIALHAQLIEKEDQLKTFLLEYSNSLNEFKNTCNKVFTNTNSKEILLEQSEQIKENSINPSFKLLEETRNNIAEVKSKIEIVDFI